MEMRTAPTERKRRVRVMAVVCQGDQHGGNESESD